MGQPLHVAEIQNNVELYIKQLENMSYSNDQARMIKLNGHIDEAIKCGALNKSVYMQRIEKANALVMADKPAAEDIGMGALEGVTLTPLMKNQSGAQAVANSVAKAAEGEKASAAAGAPQVEGGGGPTPNAG
jgi:hypothetical protein